MENENSKNYTEKLDLIIQLLSEIRDNTKPRVKKERTAAIGVGLPELAIIWNEWAHKSLSRISSMDKSGTRYRNCVKRWNEHPKKEFWVSVIERMNRSSFCLGANDRKWLADIEFLTRPDNCHKILEGKYDDKAILPGAVKEKRIQGYVTGPDGEIVPVMG